jgi:hypothetical protein
MFFGVKNDKPVLISGIIPVTGFLCETESLNRRT